MIRALIGITAAAAMCLVAPSANAATTYWQPTSAKPLPIHVNLGGTINVNNPKHVGERSISGAVLPKPAVLEIDGEANTAATVATLHSRGQKVICYFDGGVYETYRKDASKFPKSVIGKADVGWSGSYWLDVRQISILEPIMKARIDECAAKGFDGIDPDEINNYENDSGFPITFDQQLKYDRSLAQWGHEKNLTVVQKGNIGQAYQLVSAQDSSLPLGFFDATENEECYQYQECTNPWNEKTDTTQPGLQSYSNAGKAVWILEYQTKATTRMCADAPARHWNGARYKLGLPLSGGRNPCKGW